MPGICAAVQIARASCASFLLPDTKGRTALAGNSHGSWPSCRSWRAQCCEPPQASIATTHGARLAKCSRNFARVSFRSTISPVSTSTQCSWNTRFAVSTPTTVLLVFISDPPVCPRRACSSPIGTLMPSAREGPPTLRLSGIRGWEASIPFLPAKANAQHTLPSASGGGDIAEGHRSGGLQAVCKRGAGADAPAPVGREEAKG